MMYEIKAKVELSENLEFCIPDEMIREELVKRLAEQLKDKIIIYRRYDTQTLNIEYSSKIIFTNK